MRELSLRYQPATRSLMLHDGCRSGGLPGSLQRTTLGLRRAKGIGLTVMTAELGAALLPRALRPVRGESAQLVWLSVLPSRCLLIAQDLAGVRKVVNGPGCTAFERSMDELERVTAGTFDKTNEAVAALALQHFVRDECRDARCAPAESQAPPAALLDRFDKVVELVTGAVMHIAVEQPEAPFRSQPRGLA